MRPAALNAAAREAAPPGRRSVAAGAAAPPPAAARRAAPPPRQPRAPPEPAAPSGEPAPIHLVYPPAGPAAGRAPWEWGCGAPAAAAAPAPPPAGRPRRPPPPARPRGLAAAGAPRGAGTVLEASSAPGPGPGEAAAEAEERRRRQDFYANVGDVVRTLREDVPALFQRELNWSIYRDDILFRDPNISFRSLRSYRLVFWSLRFHGRLFFSHIGVEVLRMWQPDEATIKMRWRVRGRARWPLGGGAGGGREGAFDGLSTYWLDAEGKVREHMIDNMQLRDPPITTPLLYGLNLLNRVPAGVPGAPAPGCSLAPLAALRGGSRDEGDDGGGGALPPPLGGAA